MSYKHPVPIHSHNHSHSRNHNHNHSSHLTVPGAYHTLAQSSEYLNLQEPPQASKTPDIFPHRLARRSSSNYETALLSDKLRNTSVSPQREEAIVLDTSQTGSDNQPQSREGAKRSLQRASIDLTHVHDCDRSCFGVEYSPPPEECGHHSALAKTQNKPDSDSDNRTSLPRQNSFNFHTNQSDDQETELTLGETEFHFGNDQARKFEYAEFRRRMSKH